MPTQRPPTIDPIAAQRWLHAAPAHSPWLHEEVGRRMQERLQWITLQPQAWCNWGALRGGLQAHALVAQQFDQAACYVVEPDARQLQAARAALAPPWWPLRRGGILQRWRGPALPTLQWGLPPEGGVQVLWANMGLHMAADPQALMAQWHRAIAVDGYLMFSCLGPDTLRELRACYAALGWPPAGHELTDMHDWGDMLVQTGFAEPVMDMERIRLSFDSPARLLQELRGLGRNLHPARRGQLASRAWRAQLEEALLSLADPAEGGRLTLGFEIIYGHAFKPAPRLAVAAESHISLDALRSSLRRGQIKK